MFDKKTSPAPAPISTNASTKILTYREALYQTMRDALAQYPNVIIFGQGIDDHKGTFGTTLGLSKEFGKDRIVDTPLCEEATTGMVIGASLNGLYPISIHIRVDFVLLAMNQIINLAAKYKYMSGGAYDVPLMIRMVIGRSWGQGAQHSQSLQSLFAHTPGLTVIMPANPHTILDSYPYVIANCRGPVISIEHRLLYDLKFRMSEDTSGTGMNGHPLSSRKVRSGKDITIVATSIMVLEAQRAAEHLSRTKGIECDIIDLHCVSHPSIPLILESLKKTGKLLIADTSVPNYGVGAEICRLVCEHGHALLKAPAVTMGMQPAPCPTAKSLEDLYYPNLRTLSDAIGKLVTGRKDHGIPLPDEQSMADIYKRFKGPF